MASLIMFPCNLTSYTRSIYSSPRGSNLPHCPGRTYCIVQGGVEKTLFPAGSMLLSYKDMKNTYFDRVDNMGLSGCHLHFQTLGF